MSEAYFARLLGLGFIAVVPASTAAPKLAAIRHHGGEIHPVEDSGTVDDVAERLALDARGHYLNQFAYAERATDWRGNNNIAQSIIDQMAEEEHPVPRWIVCGAGTRGTSATIGRYVRYRRLASRVCVPDPAASVFHRHYTDRSIHRVDACTSLIEGVGRPRVEPSVVPGIIDWMMPVDDAESIDAMRALDHSRPPRGRLDRINFWASLEFAADMAARGERGSIVTLLCDGGERYACTYYDDAWLAAREIPWRPIAAEIERQFRSGRGG